MALIVRGLSDFSTADDRTLTLPPFALFFTGHLFLLPWSSYDRALAIKPDKYQAWNSRGIALKQLGRYEEAIASYNHALDIKPDDYEAWYNRGCALCRLGCHEEAIASWSKALAIKPDYPSAFYNSACLYALLGNAELAIENLERAINLNSTKYREMAKKDSDFEKIRGEHKFQSLINS